MSVSAGLKVSRLCLGCMTYGTSKWRAWVLDEEAPKPFFKAAIEKGIDITLTDEDIPALEAPDTPKPVMGHA